MNLISDRFSRVPSISAVGMAWILCFCLFVSSILSVHSSYLAAPYGDVWWFIRDIAKFRDGQIGLSFLWHQHSEHRLVLPRLILWIDLCCFRFRGIFPVFVSFALQVGEALLLWFAFCRIGENDRYSKLAYGGVVCGLMLSPSQLENFILPFNVQFPLAFFMATVSIFLILHYCQSSSADLPALILGISAGICGTLSLGSGLLVWPFLLLICWLECEKSDTFQIVVITTLVIGILYFAGYVSPRERANPFASLGHPVQVAAFAFTFLAGAFSSNPAAFAGIFGLTWFCIAALAFAFYIRARSVRFWRSCAFFIYLALYIAATAILAALGRINYGPSEAVSIRYRTPALIFWASVLGLGVSVWNRVAAEWSRNLCISALAVLFLVFFVAPNQREPVRHFEQLSTTINDCAIAVAFDASDLAYSQLFSPRPDFVRDYTPYLRENQLSLFTNPLLTARGKILNAYFLTIPSEECSGTLEGKRDLNNGSAHRGSVFGWAWLRTEGRGPAQVVLADERGIIVGLANGMQPRPDVAARFHNTDYLASGWSGYFHAEPSSRAINAYAISVDGKTICMFGQVRL